MPWNKTFHSNILCLTIFDILTSYHYHDILMTFHQTKYKFSNYIPVIHDNNMSNIKLHADNDLIHDTIYFLLLILLELKVAIYLSGIMKALGPWV